MKAFKAMFPIKGGLLLLLIGSMGFQCPAWADGDPSRGMIRSLETDSAAVQNTYYLSASLTNDSSYFYLYGEGLLALDKSWGLVLSFPTLIDRQPFHGASALGPVGLDLRYCFYQFGAEDTRDAGVFSLQAGGAYVFPNSSFRRLDSSLGLEALGGYRLDNAFIQGNYGFNDAADSNGVSDWFANTSLGYALTFSWFIQFEGDFSQSAASNGVHPPGQWTWIPQIGFQTGDWLFEAGEELNNNPVSTTDLLIARAF